MFGSEFTDNTVLALTPRGEQKADKCEFDGKEYDIADYLHDRGESAVWELAKGCRLSRRAVKKYAKRLKNSGYIQVMKYGEN